MMIAVILAALIILEYLGVPFNNFFWRTAFDFGHIPLFGVISIAFLGLSKSILGNRINNRLWHYVIALMATGILGVVSEIVQYYGPRDADFWDLMRDVLGAICFLGFYLTIDKDFARQKTELSRKFKYGVRIVIIAALLAASVPSLVWLLAYIERAEYFPIISNFETNWEKKFRFTQNAKLEIVESAGRFDNADSEYAGRITFKPVVNTSFYIEEPYPDWTGFQNFAFEIYSDYDSTVNLNIRINDLKHIKGYYDRYNYLLTLEPGLNKISIPLDSIKNAPESRQMDMTDINMIIFFPNDSSDSLVVYLDSIRLE